LVALPLLKYDTGTRPDISLFEIDDLVYKTRRIQEEEYDFPNTHVFLIVADSRRTIS
jgi:hypothetical protein